jgi:hypothetical protein
MEIVARSPRRPCSALYGHVVLTGVLAQRGGLRRDPGERIWTVAYYRTAFVEPSDRPSFSSMARLAAMRLPTFDRLHKDYNTYSQYLDATNEGVSGVCRTVQVVQSLFLPSLCPYIHARRPHQREDPRGSSCILYDAYNTFCTIHIRNIWTLRMKGSLLCPYIHGEKTPPARRPHHDIAQSAPHHDIVSVYPWREAVESA